MSAGSIVGWDLGGAHLKAVVLDGHGGVRRVIQLPCPLWQGLAFLHEALAGALDQVGAGAGTHAVTMTGELVDLFRDRDEGVRTLISELQARVPRGTLRVWAGRAGLLDPAAAARASAQVASANWLASVTLAAERLEQGLFVDLGSTTADVLVFAGHEPRNLGWDDHQRMRHGELLYTGVVRTPVMALAVRVPVDGEWVALMAEHFATAADVHRLTGALPESADILPSADAGPKTPLASARRLARMVGRDAASASEEVWRALAAHLGECQLWKLQQACARVLSRQLLAPQAPLVGAGVGRFVLRRLAERLRRPYVDFNEFFAPSPQAAPDVGDCAPAAAVAALAAGRPPGGNG